MSARRPERERWLRDFTAGVIAVLAAAAVVFAFEARGQGAQPDGVATVTTSAPISGSGTAGSPITCTSASGAAAGCVTTGAQTLGGQKTFAGGALITEGTEALPGLAAEDDPDTGIRLGSAANTISSATSATERGRLTTSELRLLNSTSLWAGVIRDPNGNWQIGFSSVSGNTRFNQASATGLAHHTGNATTMTAAGVIERWTRGSSSSAEQVFDITPFDVGTYDGVYLRAGDNNAGAPAAGDCDADAERGRLSLDTTNFRLYVCRGATGGWDYAQLTD